MRLAVAHVSALVVYVGALYLCFALPLGLGGGPVWGYQFNSAAFEFAILYMMFIGPFALILMLAYFALLRARPLAIMILLVLSLVGLGFALRIVPVRGDAYSWIGIIWAGVTAALVHHLVYAALKPHGTREPVSYA
jgi:hypothetical protein